MENLLEINWYERPTAGEVRAVLEPYEERIRNLEPFTPSKEKSKAMLDSYQTGSKNKKSSHEQKANYPAMLNPDFKQSPQSFMINSPSTQTINPIKINTYPQHQLPVTTPAPITYIPPLKNH